METDSEETDVLTLVDKSLDELIEEQDKDEDSPTEDDDLYDEDSDFFPSLWDKR